MAFESTGNKTSVFWGFFRLSAEGGLSNISPKKTLIDIPPTLETSHRSQQVGSDLAEDMSFQTTRFGLEDDILNAWNLGTAYPMVQMIRGTALNSCGIVESSRVVGTGGTEGPDSLKARDVSFGAGGPWKFESGLLFDHTIAHASGVTATLQGSTFTITGGIPTGSTMTVYFANPHDPAPTVVGGVCKLISAETDFATPTDMVTFATATTTAAYEVNTIASTDTAADNDFWRFEVTAISSGTFYPVCCIWIHTT